MPTEATSPVSRSTSTLTSAVYSTLAFTSSKASPKRVPNIWRPAGLQLIEFDQDLPDDIASALLGSATLSFYASRVVFCEGDERSLDKALCDAWFNDLGTVVRPVETRDMVMRCVSAMNEADLAQGLSAIGIVDRDYHSDNFLAAMPVNIHPLAVHEVERLLALPADVRAAARHLGTEFDEERYVAQLRATVSEAQRHVIVIQRWKARIEPHLAGLVAQSANRNASLDMLIAEMPALFDMNTWNFSPQGFLEEEKQRVEPAVETGTADEFLALIPGKQCAPVAARQLGMNLDAYVQLIIHGLTGSDEPNVGEFGDELEQALAGMLPARRVPADG